MDVSIEDILSSTKISYWTFQWYRREGLLPGPIRHEKLRGKGSLSFYPDWIVERIRDIQTMREGGMTVAQVRRTVKWRVSEKLATTIQSSFEAENGEEVTPSYPLTPADVFKQITRQIAAGYPGYLVRKYRVKSKKGLTEQSWHITMEMSEGESRPSLRWAPPGEEKNKTKGRKEKKD